MEKRVPGYLREYSCISILVHTFNTVYPILLASPVDRIIFEYEKHNLGYFLKECCHAGTLLLLAGKCFSLTCVVLVVKRSALFIVIVPKPLIEPMKSQFLNRRRYAWLSLGILVGMPWPRVDDGRNLFSSFQVYWNILVSTPADLRKRAKSIPRYRIVEIYVNPRNIPIVRCNGGVIRCLFWANLGRLTVI